MSADLTLVIEAVEKNTAAIAKVANSLQAQTNRMVRAFEKIQKTQRETGNSTKTLQDKFRQIAVGAIRQLGTALVNLAQRGLRVVIAAMADGVRKAIEFERAIAEVFTLADGGVTNMGRLRDSVKALAEQFGGQLTTQARALYQAISAGAETGAESIKVMEVANKLAIGGVTDQATAIDGLTSVLNAFGLNMEAFSDIVAQKFFTAMRKGKTTVGELSANIGVLAPTANAAGLSLDEMFAAVSAITTGGIKTETAIISLNQALVAMLKPTKQAREEADRLGIEFNALVLRKKGLSGFFRELMGNSKLTDESMTKLFGNVRALRAVLALSNNDGEKFAEILQAMEENTDDADQAFEKMTATLGHQVDLMNAAGEAASESFGNMVTEGDTATSTVKNLTTALRGLEKIFDSGASAGVFDKFIDGLRVMALSNPATQVFAAQMELIAVGLKSVGEEAETTDAQVNMIRKRLAVSAKNAQGYVATLESLGMTDKQINEILAEGTRIRQARAEQEKKDAKALKDAFEARRKAQQEAAEDEENALTKLNDKLDRVYSRAMKKLEREDRKKMRLIARGFRADLREEAKKEREQEKMLKKKARAREKMLKEEQRTAESIAQFTSNAIIDIFDVLGSKAENKGEQIKNMFLGILKTFASKALSGLLGFAFGAGPIGGLGGLLFGATGGVVPHGLTSKPVKMDTGGILRGGQQGKDSIPVMAKAGEEFLTKQDRRIVDKALESRGSNVSVALSVAVPNKPISRAETYRWAVRDLGPMLTEAIRNGAIKV